jgi:hypothetical protein
MDGPTWRSPRSSAVRWTECCNDVNARFRPTGHPDPTTRSAPRRLEPMRVEGSAATLSPHALFELSSSWNRPAKRDSWSSRPPPGPQSRYRSQANPLGFGDLCVTRWLPNSYKWVDGIRTRVYTSPPLPIARCVVGFVLAPLGEQPISAFFLLVEMPHHRPDTAVEPLSITIEDLPSDVAREIRECQLQDPALLRRILLFGATHKVVFETLQATWHI